MTVSDAQVAESLMQRVLLADDSLVVKEFKKHKADLEGIFISLVEGDHSDE